MSFFSNFQEKLKHNSFENILSVCQGEKQVKSLITQGLIKHSKKQLSLLFLSVIGGLISNSPSLAQSVISAGDNTATIVTQDGDRFTIDGGTLSGGNLFHSFQEFGLSMDETAIFLSDPTILNILGRVVGGNPSVIDGSLQMTGGDSNLFLMNPAGIVFGENGRLDLSGSFSATTATGIEFGEGRFSATGDNNYADLGGDPTAFLFGLEQPSSIINAGNLEVPQGQNISLVGGDVVNTGTLKAPGGNISIVAVPGTSRVRVSQPGWVVSLEIDSSLLLGGSQAITSWDLVRLLTEGTPSVDTGLQINGNGAVELSQSGVELPTEGETAIASGVLDVTNTTTTGTGGEVAILGERVGLIGAEINASGDAGGGRILVGGDSQELSTVPNAETTSISQDSVIRANAETNGDGGTIIVWANGTTAVNGEISARGGFVGISGKETLLYRGNVSNGELGEFFLNTEVITIIDGEDSVSTISKQALEQLSANTKVTLHGDDGIHIENLVNNQLTFQSEYNQPDNRSTSGGAVIAFAADADNDGIGDFWMNDSEDDSEDKIIARQRTININAANIRIGSIITAVGVDGSSNILDDNGNGGSINITANTNTNTPDNNIYILGDLDSSVPSSGDGHGGEIRISSEGGLVNISNGVVNSTKISGGSVVLNALNNVTTGMIDATNSEGISITANEIDFEGGADSVNSISPIVLKARNSNLNIDIGDIFDTSHLNLDTDDMKALSGEDIEIGSNLDTGTVYLRDVSTPVSSVLIKGGFKIVGPDSDAGNLWQITDFGKGIIGEVEFKNIVNITGGEGNDIFKFRNNASVTTLNDEGTTLNDIADYSAYTTSLSVNLESLQADGIDKIIGSANNDNRSTLTAFDGTNTWNVTGSNSGVVRNTTQSINFGNFQNITGNSNDDTFEISNGGSVGTINGEDGINSLYGDDVINTWDITGINSGTLNEATHFSNIQSLVGGTSNDNFKINGGSINNIQGDTGINSLYGDNVTNTWNITGTNNGKLNEKITFSSIQTLIGGNAEDTFNLSGTAILDGTLDGGSGDNNQLNFTSYETAVRLYLGHSLATGIGRFSNIQTMTGSNDNDTVVGSNNNTIWSINGANTTTIDDIITKSFENLIGGSGNDTFEIKNNGSALSIDGGLGDNSLFGDNTNNTWNITDINSGDLNKGQNLASIQSFSNIQNLTGGDSNDTFTVSRGSVSQIDGGGSTNNSLVGGNINNIWNLTQANNGTLNGANSFSKIQNLVGGNTDDTFNFNLDNGTFLNSNIDGGIIDVDSGSSGTLELKGDRIETSGEITSSGITILTASNDIQTQNISAPGQQLTIVSTEGAITTTNLTTENTSGNGGNVTLNAQNSIKVASINAQGGSNNIGGDVNVETGRLFQAISTFEDRNNVEASISSSGGAGGGSITIRHNGGLEGELFTVGRDTRVQSDEPNDNGAPTNGTAGAIISSSNNSDNAIAPTRFFPASYEQGNIRIITPDSQNSLTSPTGQPLPDATESDSLAELILRELEDSITAEFATYYGRVKEDPKSLSTIQTELNQVQMQTDSQVRPAAIYPFFIKSDVDIDKLVDLVNIPGQRSTQTDAEWRFFSEQKRSLFSAIIPYISQPEQNTDKLVLMVVTAQGQPILKPTEFNFKEVTENAMRLQLQLESKNKDSLWNLSAKSLYEYLIKDIETDLQAQDINNLLFIMDSHLRLIPVATLFYENENKEKEFLIEKYSVSLVPSMSLISTQYRDIRNEPFLVMGTSNFEESEFDPKPKKLDGVETEMQFIDRNWQGRIEVARDEDFNITRLKEDLASEKSFRLLHLATHAEFKEGEPKNSYIHFNGDELLRLDRKIIEESLGSLDQIDLLTLSACQTALGNREAELGFAGIAYQTGAKSTLASLIKVDDIGTASLMAHFYQNLTKFPTKAEALQQAQLAMRRGQVTIENNELTSPTLEERVPLPQQLVSEEKPDFTHPRYWGVFTIVGSPW